MRKGKDKRTISNYFSLQALIAILVIAVLAFVIGRMWGENNPASNNEISNIASILEVLVAVLAIIGFELFLQIQDALRKVEKFDERMDKIELSLSDIRSELFQFYGYGEKVESAVSETLQLQSIASISLQILTMDQKDPEYQDGMAIVFSKAAEILSYSSRLFKVYFDDINNRINKDEFNEVLNSILYFSGSVRSEYAEVYRDILNLRLQLAIDRIKKWSELKGRFSLSQMFYPEATGEEKSKRDVEKYFKEKIEHESKIMNELNKALTSVEMLISKELTA